LKSTLYETVHQCDDKLCASYFILNLFCALGICQSRQPFNIRTKSCQIFKRFLSSVRELCVIRLNALPQNTILIWIEVVTMHPRIASSLAEQQLEEQLEERSAVRTLRRGAPSISFAGKRANN